MLVGRSHVMWNVLQAWRNQIQVRERSTILVMNTSREAKEAFASGTRNQTMLGQIQWGVQDTMETPCVT